MSRHMHIRKAGSWLFLVLSLASMSHAQSGRVSSTSRAASNAGAPTAAERPSFIRAFVIDDRLSALRREADMQAQVIQRLRLGRPVYIIESRGGKNGQPKFYRVAVTRRTRGWVHSAAIAVAGRAGDDERVVKLIENAGDGMDKITLCHIFIDRFSRSPLLPRALFLMAEEADRAASVLTARARRRLSSLDKKDSQVKLRDYYLNDPGLDRYSKLNIHFDFNEETLRYVYDGKAYRDLLKRFPRTDEAKLARKRLGLVEKTAG